MVENKLILSKAVHASITYCLMNRFLTPAALYFAMKHSGKKVQLVRGIRTIMKVKQLHFFILDEKQQILDPSSILLIFRLKQEEQEDFKKKIKIKPTMAKIDFKMSKGEAAVTRDCDVLFKKFGEDEEKLHSEFMQSNKDYKVTYEQILAFIYHFDNNTDELKEKLQKQKNDTKNEILEIN